MLAMNRDSHIREAARNQGADGFVSKDSDGEDLLQGIRLLREGRVDFLDIAHTRREISDNPYRLTRQERAIAGLVCGGMNSEQISKKLSISIHTAHTHRRRILEKTGSATFMEVCQKLT
jgi:DNA-binding NarL/FixJ family response regulator